MTPFVRSKISPGSSGTATAGKKSCIVFARFQSGIDCSIHKRWLHASCDIDAPPGEIHCRPADAPMHRKMYFSKCSTGNIAFADVRDGGDWIE